MWQWHIESPGPSVTKTASALSPTDHPHRPISLDCGEDLRRLAVFGHGIDRPGFRLGAGHAWRSRGHTGQGDPSDGRLFRQQLANDVDRHVAIDNIATDEHRVTAFEIFRNAGRAADLCKIIGRFHFDLKSVLLEILSVAFAAGALRVLVKRRQYRLRRMHNAR